MEQKTLKSPIYYVGNKTKLIKKIKPLFPKGIKNFYDIFGGSGVVSLNVTDIAEHIHYNEYNKTFAEMFKYFKTVRPEVIDEKIKALAIKYNLPIDKTASDFTKEEHEEIKKKFVIARDEIIENPSILGYIFIQQYTFSNMINIQNGKMMKGGTAYGQRFYKSKLMKSKMQNVINKNISITEMSYELFSINAIEPETSFFYLDPPYFNTNANYNQEQGWTWEMEQNMLKYAKLLNKLGIKFAISNVIYNKGVVNKHLIEFVKENNFELHTWDHKYSAMSGTNSKKAVECLITNYKIKGETCK